MEVKVLSSSKEEIELQVDSLTLAEILRVYLNQDEAVSFAAWKRLHPTENPILAIRVKEGSAQKALDRAISAASKELDNFIDNFSKLK